MRGDPSDKPRPSGVGRGKPGKKRGGTRQPSPPRVDASSGDDDDIPLGQRADALEAAAEDPPRTPHTRSQGPAVSGATEARVCFYPVGAKVIFLLEECAGEGEGEGDG